MIEKERTRARAKEEEVLPSCDVCMKEIPSSAAVSVECGEYVQHFCGNDCYARWKEKADESNQ